MTSAIEKYDNKAVTVIGANGYIGSSLTEALGNYSAKIMRVSRNKLTEKSGVVDIQADMTEFDCWKEIVGQSDIIFHLAGNTSLYAAAGNPQLSLNATVLPLNHLIAAAQQAKNTPRVVFASTATIYGLTEDLPIAESVQVKPITIYDLHKYFAEQQLALASSQGIITDISLRLANVYGPSSATSSAGDRGILNMVSRRALSGSNLCVYGDGNYIRDYVYIDDVVNAFLLAGVYKGHRSQVLNVASGTGHTLKEAFEMVANCAAEVTGEKVGISNAPWPDGADAIEHRHFIADVDALYTALKWRPEVQLEEGVKKMIKAFRAEVNL